MQQKSPTINFNFVRSRKYLSMIPMLSLTGLLLLWTITFNPIINNNTYALEINREDVEDILEEKDNPDKSLDSYNDEEISGSQESLNAGISTQAASSTAALIIDNGSDANLAATVSVAAGTVGYREHTVRVQASGITEYGLTISGSENLTGPSNATISIGGAGNKTPAQMDDNTWGYGWGASNTAKENLAYQTLSITGKPLTGDNIDANGMIDFTRKLVFAAKFGEKNTNTGNYTAKVNLALVVTPPTVVGMGEWRTSKATVSSFDSSATILARSGITTMQEMSQAICDQVKTPTKGEALVPTIKLIDSRDKNEYIVAKYVDGRCWMAENLRLINKNITSADSDMTTTTPFGVPASAKSGFTLENQYNPKAYLSSEYESIAGSNVKVGVSGYYNWYTATAGAGNSLITADGTTVDTSICPKNWTLPIGGSDSEYSNLLKTKAEIYNTPEGSTTIQAAPYNFSYTRYLSGSNYVGADHGYWWSNAAYKNSSNSAYGAYNLQIDASHVLPNTSGDKYRGLAIRCIARNE